MKSRGGRRYLGFGDHHGVGGEEEGWCGRDVVAIRRGQACGRIEGVGFLATAQPRPRRRFAAGQPILEHKTD